MRRRFQEILRGIWKSLGLGSLKLAFFLSADRRRRLERWLRGYTEYRRLQEADFVVVSHAKSGRTWLRVMLSRFFQLRYGIPERFVFGFDNLHAMDRRVPKIFFTHDNYLRDCTGKGETRTSFRDKRMVLLVRSPQDVVISSYFQWKFRTQADKKELNQLPPHGADISMFEFAMSKTIGLPHIVSFLNEWSRALPGIREILVVRYEDLRAEPEKEFGRITEFIDGPAGRSCVAEAVDFASLARSRSREAQIPLSASRGKLKPGEHGNPDSYKVRRAKVGGYRDDFEKEELQRIDDYVRTHLEPGFGYEGEATATTR
jgi:hypothetical protein